MCGCSILTRCWVYFEIHTNLVPLIGADFTASTEDPTYAGRVYASCGSDTALRFVGLPFEGGSDEFAHLYQSGHGAECLPNPQHVVLRKTH